jgi:RNA polymerase sigma-70 factor (ECF subfamily)
MIRAAKRKLYMARIPNAADVAEDVVQNAFVKLTMYVKAINFNVSERELRSYVLSTVAREVINELEDRREHDDIDEYLNIASDEDFVKDVMTHERYEAVVAAIEQLDEKYRLALEYHFYKGFSVKQMAELFEVPEKTIYTRISRAQKKLKEMLGEEN